jgi:hypothetical protein
LWFFTPTIFFLNSPCHLSPSISGLFEYSSVRNIWVLDLLSHHHLIQTARLYKLYALRKISLHVIMYDLLHSFPWSKYPFSPTVQYTASQ